MKRSSALDVPSIGGLGAALLTLAPLSVLVSLALVRHEWALGVAIASSAMLSLGGLWHEKSEIAKWLAVLGLVVVPLAAHERLLASPALTLVVVGAVAIATHFVLDLPYARRAGLFDSTGAPEVEQLAALRVACALALFAWFLAAVMGAAKTDVARGSVATALVVACVFVVRWLASRATRRARIVIGGALLAGFGGALALPGGWALTSLAIGPLVALLGARRAEGSPGPAWLGVILDHPARLVVTTFVALCVLGTALLSLPLASSARQSIGFVDAAFTSVSAVCVTGLIVLDTPNAFSGFGQAAILLLIQVGGLGIMSFYTVALQFLGRRISLRHEITVAGAMGVEQGGRMFGALRRVLVVTFAAEAVGAVILTLAFAALGEPLSQAAWRGVFTAVSAFCNAGFALQTDSLIPHQQNLVVLHTVAALIVLGGLSPLAIVSLPELVQRRRVPVQVKIIYAATLVLLVAGTLAYAAFEWTHSLEHLSRWHRAHNAWFQSVTLRTAGFNSVDLASTTDATRTMMMMMMLIGGSPGGTAGGLKTTTAAVLVLAVVAALAGRSRVVAFGRHILHTSVYKAAAVATLGMLSVLGGVAAVQLTQRMPFDVGVFEVVSAIATVGLSLGGTALLDDVGKLLVMVCMFMGRVGPITLFLFLADRRPQRDWDYPDEAVDVG